jgi:TolB protein
VVAPLAASEPRPTEPGTRRQYSARWSWLSLALALLTLSSGLACRPTGGGEIPGQLARSAFGKLELVNTRQGTSESITGANQTPGAAIDPVWSPDGRELAYIKETVPEPGSPVPLGRSFLHAYNPGSGEHRLIREEPPGALLSRPAWAPDGQSLYYTRMEHRFEGPRYLGFQEMIMRIGRDGRNPTQVIADAASPSPSPDGKHLAFLSHEPGPREAGLWRLDLATGATTFLLATSPPTEVNGPTYAPNGQAIALSASSLASGANRKAGRAFWEPPVAAAHGAPADIWLINPDGTNLRRLSHLNEDRLLPAWAPDGQAIAALGQAGLFIFGLDGAQRARLERLGGEGSVTWGRTP